MTDSVLCLVPYQHRHSGKTPAVFFLSASQTYGFRSVFSIHNQQPISSQPFQVAGRRGLMRRRTKSQDTTSRLITREAATTEYCVASPRHTGKESALYLCHHHTPHPKKKSLRGSAACEPRVGESQDCERRHVIHACHHTCSPRLCNTTPDVLRYAIIMVFNEIQARSLAPVAHSLTFMSSMTVWAHGQTEYDFLQKSS